jgi:hypothetical protein
MSEEEWDKVCFPSFFTLFGCWVAGWPTGLRCRGLMMAWQCWAANVKVPKALLSEARATFEANPEGGHLITTGSVAVCFSCCSSART